MLEKKAHNIAVLDLREVKNAIADYFVICSGNSDTQVDAITTSVEEEVIKSADSTSGIKKVFKIKSGFSLIIWMWFATFFRRKTFLLRP